MNETLTIFMVSRIERFGEEGRESARRTYHNMLCTSRESAGKEEIGLEEVSPVFLDEYEHQLLGKRSSWNTVSTYMCALRAGYNGGMRGRLGYIIGLFNRVHIDMHPDVKRAVSPGTVGRMTRMAGHPSGDASGEVVDWFVLTLMLRGIPFVGLVYLRGNNPDKGVLTYCRHKTRQGVTIAVPHEAMETINGRMAENCHPSYLLPILGQFRIRRRYTKRNPAPYQEYQCALHSLNRRLERVSVELKLGGRPSSYTVCHTWVTVAFHQETLVGVISCALGYPSARVTEIYLKPLGDREVDRADRKIIRYVLNVV